MKQIVLLLIMIIGLTGVRAQTSLTLKNNQLELIWQKNDRNWQLEKIQIKIGNRWVGLPNPSGEGTLLFSALKPASTPEKAFHLNTGKLFPEPAYKHKKPQWDETINPVSLNTAGEAFFYYPTKGKKVNDNHLQFESETDFYTLITEWRLDDKHENDIIVSQTLKVKKDGYYSLASPTLTTINEQDLSWVTVPGYFQGNTINKDFVQAYAYGMGIPDLPVIYRDRCASTLCPIISSKGGITYSVIPDTGLARDPWSQNKNTLNDWFLGLSHKNRKSEFFPTLYYPVLGEPKSALKTGESITYGFRYNIINGDWFKTLNHAIYDVYKFKESLALRQSKQSLTDRVEKMRHYLTNPVTSMWNVTEYKGTKIGAQSYMGGAMGADNDAMKNSDYGAMWFLAKTTGDTSLIRDVLPYALNFKLAQQIDTGFFKGAIEGQYYLGKKKKFIEEWGSVVEPIGVTYYTMLDIGNMLLFEPNNEQLLAKLKLGANFLLNSQKPDGHWAVAYEHTSREEIFKDIPDVRPTFYGLVVAYRILKDEKYLRAARKGADWFLKNAVNTGSFLGVCGDARYSPDFATGQSAQALLDLYDLTKEDKYKSAAINTAKMYVNSIYTHPVAGNQIKYVKGKPVKDWEISQSGLSFEHGGILGSANRAGPILLISHAGLFIRMFELTNEPIFADMARAGAIGRDAFVDPKTSVASYYWNAMDKGAGPYPHHAWWQIGWITDYLLAEAQLRSKGEVNFPRGFVTPKVGPHQTVGFAPGKIYGDVVDLILKEGFVKSSSPVVDYLLARSRKKNTIYVVLLNNRAQESTFRLDLLPEVLNKQIVNITQRTQRKTLPITGTTLSLPGFGQEVLTINLKDTK